MVELILNYAHLDNALGRALSSCRHRLFISTADVKDLHLPLPGGRRSRSIVDAFNELAGRGVEIRLLHAGVPSGPFIQELKARRLTRFVMRRCVRIHAKAIVVDGTTMYLGSANLTGAGLGAKSDKRRNFEAGIWTDELHLIDPVTDMLDAIWNGARCEDCGRKAQCPVPLEEPAF